MRRFFAGLLAAVAGLFSAAPSHGQITARVVRVIDGDTVEVVMQDRSRVRVRIAGIDAPERDQRYGVNAANFVASKASGRTVTLDVRDTDKYGRMVALIKIDGGDLGRWIIRHGYAWHYYNRGTLSYSENREYRNAQKVAQSEGRGLWQDGRRAVEPWKHRQVTRSEAPGALWSWLR